MASSLWKLEQYRRHGHLVAAIEASDRRIDSTLPAVVHRLEHAEGLLPPSSFLSLLTYCCLGVASLDEAITKLLKLPETRELRHSLRRSLDRGRWYLAPEGLNLETFFGGSGAALGPTGVDHRQQAAPSFAPGDRSPVGDGTRLLIRRDAVA